LVNRDQHSDDRSCSGIVYLLFFLEWGDHERDFGSIAINTVMIAAVPALPTFTRVPGGCTARESTRFRQIEVQIDTKPNRPLSRDNTCQSGGEVDLTG
jgi:hypothetical protein